MQSQKGSQDADAIRESLIGIFALHMMEKGSVYGSDVANRIKELTEGTWKPGAGAIYPTLNRLVKKDFARIDLSDSRKKYHITARGKAYVEDVKKRFLFKSKYAFAWRLVLEMVEPEARVDFVVKRFRSGLETIEEILSGKDYLSAEEKSYLAKTVVEEMQRSMARISRLTQR
ncbi:MAG: PadR family transcriptional regulator [Conexivisphaerales archaeon]